MDYLKAIARRKSRRSYMDTPIDEHKRRQIEDRIRDINECSGLCIRYIAEGAAAFEGFKHSYGMFKGVRALLVMAGPAQDAHLKEKVGYYGELLVLEATDMDLGTCWVGGTFDQQSRVLKQKPEESIVCVIPIGNVQAPALKERMVYKVAHRGGKTAKQMMRVQGEAPEWFLKGMQAVQQAPSARNTQKTLFTYDANGVQAKIADDYPFDLVDLGIAKLHFELAAGGCFETGNPGRYHRETPRP